MSDTKAETKTIAVYAPSAPYLEPYFQRGLGDVELVFQSDGIPDLEGANYAVMISSTDVYGNPPLPWQKDADSRGWTEMEDAFARSAVRARLTHSVLRCPPVVCTGMQGFCRSLVGRVNNGMFFHVPGLSPKLSVVHAVDIARAAGLLSDRGVDGKVFDVTDGVNPTIDDLAEAFAFRLDDKRIGELKPMLAKFLMGLRYCRRLAAGLPEYSCSPLVEECGFEPTSVVEYLRTHDYGENSL